MPCWPAFWGPSKQQPAHNHPFVYGDCLCSVPNITHMWSAYASQDRFYLIMEYCSGGNLLDFLKAQQPHAVSEQWLATAVSRHTLGFATQMCAPPGWQIIKQWPALDASIQHRCCSSAPCPAACIACALHVKQPRLHTCNAATSLFAFALRPCCTC
jgi:hypothetical protein